MEKMSNKINEQLFCQTAVIKSFYCNQDDGEYNNNPCSEQCKFCENVEKLNNMEASELNKKPFSELVEEVVLSDL